MEKKPFLAPAYNAKIYMPNIYVKGQAYVLAPKNANKLSTLQ